MRKITKITYTQTYNELSDAIFRYCYLRISDRETAKDLTQETFIKVWRYLENGNKVDNMRALMYKTASNLIIDEYRKRKTLSLDQLKLSGFDIPSRSHEDIHNCAMVKEIVEFMHKLDDKYKEVLILRYVDNLSSKEIAEIVGETQNNVSVRINRGFKKLKKIVNK